MNFLGGCLTLSSPEHTSATFFICSCQVLNDCVTHVILIISKSNLLIFKRLSCLPKSFSVVIQLHEVRFGYDCDHSKPSFNLTRFGSWLPYCFPYSSAQCQNRLRKKWITKTNFTSPVQNQKPVQPETTFGQKITLQLIKELFR